MKHLLKTIPAALLLLASCQKELSYEKAQPALIEERHQVSNRTPGAATDTTLTAVWVKGYGTAGDAIYDTVTLHFSSKNKKHYNNTKDVINLKKAANDLIIKRDGKTLQDAFMTFRDNGFDTRWELRAARPTDTTTSDVIKFYPHNLEKCRVFITDVVVGQYKISSTSVTVVPFTANMKRGQLLMGMAKDN